MVHGVLDRIENGIATIIIDELHEQLSIADSELPEGSKEGTWFLLKKKDNSFEIIKIDKEKTTTEWQHSTSLMNKLQSRKRSSKFKRK